MKLKGKKVLVTGADGFIGSHLVEGLLDQGCKVKAFVYYNSFNHWGWLDTLPKERLKKIEVVAGDIRDPHGVRSALKRQDAVFHLAALIGIPYSYDAPDNYIDTNIKGTLNVLQAAKEEKLSRVIVTSTSEVYGTARYVPIDEKHPRQGQSPYSATKIGADSVAESFYRSFNLPVTIVRPFNTYGPRQSARAIIPTLIAQLVNGFQEIKVGALHPTRDLTYVLDTVSAFLAVAGSEKTIGEEVNIANQDEIAIGDLAKKLIKMINPKAKVMVDKKRLRPKGSEVERLFGNASKLRRLTGWRPRFTLEQGLKETIAWFSDEDNLKRYKADIYNV